MTALGGPLRSALSRQQQAAAALRRTRFVAQVKTLAWQKDATVELDLAPDVTIGRGLEISIDVGSHSVLRLGAGSSLGNQVTLAFKGGRLLGGERVEIRHRCVVNLTGVLVLEGDNVFSWGTALHCANDIHIGHKVGAAEGVSIADSNHFFTTEDEHFWHNVRLGSVRIGANTWLCPKSTVVMGADIGSHCIVASSAVVTGVIPSGSLAAGAPAVAKPLRLPWRNT